MVMCSHPFTDSYVLVVRVMCWVRVVSGVLLCLLDVLAGKRI
jgi:hypothetical protein